MVDERRPMTGEEIRGMRGHLVETMVMQQAQIIATLRADLAKAKEALPSWPDETAWPFGTQVSKKSGSEWHGKIVGYYSTALTPRGYCVESSRERGSVQIYPEAALEELSHD